MTLEAELRAIAAGRTLSPEAVLAFDRARFLTDAGEVKRDDLVAWVAANSTPAGDTATGEDLPSDAGRAVLAPHVADALVRLADPRRADALAWQADLDQLGADLAAERARREARYAATPAPPASAPPANPRPMGDADLGPRPGPHPMDPRAADLAQIERDLADATRRRGA